MKKVALISVLGVFALFLVGVFSINIGSEGVAGETQDGCLVGGITVECPDEINQITLKAVPAGADVVLIEDSAASWFKKKATVASIAAGGIVFGQNFSQAESLGLSTTTSSTYQTKLTLNTGSLPIGTYRFGWSVEYQGKDKGSAETIFVRVILDDATVYGEINGALDKMEDDDEWMSFSGFAYTAFGSATTHNVKIQWRNQDNVDNASVRRARLEVWRVQ